jgi:hypothetical protein
VKITVLSPRPQRAPADEDPGPGLDSLEGAVIGLRTDYIWPEWDVVSSEWAAVLEARGAQLRFWRAGHRSGDEGEKTAEELEAFIAEVDLAVVGLGN